MKEKEHRNMEQVNNVSTEFNEEQVKARIQEEVMSELQEQGVTVIPNHYEYGEHILALVDKYDRLKAKYDKDVEYNNNRYKDNVAQELNKHLTNEFEIEKADIIRQLEDVEATDMRWRQYHIEKLQQEESYLIAKDIAFQELSYLKGVKDIPSDLLTDIISSCVKAYDVRSLYIMSTMLGGQSSMPGRTIEYVRQDLIGKINTTDSKPYIDGARAYIKDNELDIRLMTLANKYKK